MMDDLSTRAGEFLRANVTIGDWTQSRLYSRPSCSTSLSSARDYEYQSVESDEWAASNHDKQRGDVESEFAQHEIVLRHSRQNEAINYQVAARASNLQRSGSGYDARRRLNVSGAGICGQSGSVRGYRDFVRQSARYLHEWSELTANDQLIYVNSSSLLSKKLLEQETNDAGQGDRRECSNVNRVTENRMENLVEDGGREQVEGEEGVNYEIVELRQDEKVNVDDRVDNNNQIWERKRQALRALYLENLISTEQKQDSCVLYTTSLSVVRKTFDDSKLMRNILTLNLIRFEERDVYLNREYKIQLRLRLMATKTTTEPHYSKFRGNQVDKLATDQSTPALSNPNLPCLFVEGRLFCNLKDLELLNETSQLCKILTRYKMPGYSSNICKCCGNARFIACQNCNGSRRSLVHHFRFSSIALRCTRCDKNDGLIACPACNNPVAP